MIPAAFVKGFKDYPAGFAWPGGYPVALQMSDGESICPACAKKEAWQIFHATRENRRTGWEAAAWFIHWEGHPLICAHCNGEMASAYGDPEEDQAGKGEGK